MEELNSRDLTASYKNLPKSRNHQKFPRRNVYFASQGLGAYLHSFRRSDTTIFAVFLWSEKLAAHTNKAAGCPIADPTTAQRVGSSPVKGLILLQDTQLIETLAHFSRERIPERTVHASAVGAWGEFVVDHDISHLTSAKFLNGIGKKSKVLLRISTVGPERGSAETVRDVRGWGMKIFTEEGNQDFVFNNIVRCECQTLESEDR